MEGLARLEYRGYDSPRGPGRWDHVVTTKARRELANLIRALALEPLPESSTAIGHTRWATHGHRPTRMRTPTAVGWTAS